MNRNHKIRNSYSLGLLLLLSEFLFIESKLVDEVGGHLLQLIIREGLMNNKSGNIMLNQHIAQPYQIKRHADTKTGVLLYTDMQMIMLS